MQQPPLIEIRNVGKTFPGVQALNGVSLTLRAGEVHAVIGENGAGKSTLMNMLAGELLPDTGSILVAGEDVRLSSPLKSKALGINVVFQELSLCHNLTVGENVMMQGLARTPGLGLISRSRASREATRLLTQLGLGDLDPTTPVHELTIAQMQLIEIARAISQDLRVLVLDEPNSALSPHETARMLQIIRALRADGVAIVYVSHNLDEVRSIADRITVLRDGQHVTTMDNDQSVTVDRLVSAMVGRDLAAVQQYALVAPAVEATRPVLAVHQLAVPGQIARMSFELYPGEILGVAGMPNSGKDSLSDALFGLIPRGGTVEIDGAPVPPENPGSAIASGMALIPADRRRGGALLLMSVAHNVVSASLAAFSVGGILRQGAIARTTNDYVDKLDIRISDVLQRIGTLSGGNQQKAILARGLVTKPKVLILHEPTRGIDVGAKEEIYAILAALASEGMAVMMISSELPEIVLHSSRVLVMERGRVAATFRGAEITEEAIMQAALGQLAVAAE
ncbi:MAG: sugar ABC transporter ATP-binding protein [Devosia sp.]|uniref:sugar ABC transporter ATP-binding protein n=1 Tax=Devosia sp. 66-22 TaxID=1895753 RepID=UPI000928AE43|nr:sugar ABC transporter ATP-binding protein [Devosia sp. 66-22]MBN9345027.1 sugar ABC transporter ATP-binding protein [Devosia sp.]OJX46304.1 MAG: sugar ABC transporter ATP-binding protein [Devosia sp. 66-22]